MAEITITLNGEPHHLASATLLSDLIDTLLIPTTGLIVDYNGTLYKEPNTLTAIPLAEGDTVDLIHFMGGG